jgi:hypothetical protein
MTRARNRTRLLLWLITPLIIALACNTLTGAGPAASTPAPVTVQKDIVYGSGPFNLPDAAVGLPDLSSYVATLVLSFDGTRDGQPEKWSQTYVMQAQKDPAARLLTIEKSGDLSDLDPVFMAEAGGTDYERVGDGACSATLLETGNSLSDRMEPANLLNYAIGADEAGSDTVNGIPAAHYTFDQLALGQEDRTQSTGEVWVASEGGYVVQYVLSTTAKADFFGEGIEGTLSFDYELTDVNKPIEINIPAECPPGFVDAPQLPDASNVASNLGVLTYDSATSVQDAAAFYQQKLPDEGWQAAGEPSITDESALLAFERDSQSLTVSISSENGITTILIAVLRKQE